MDQPPTQVVEIVCNVDDASGEVIGAAVDTLLAEGALDAWTTPVSMKKNRPGVMLSVLCAADERDALTRRVIGLTGSFGVRYRSWDRVVLEREHVSVATRFGDVRLKVGRLDGAVVVAKPEFDDVAAVASKHGVTIREAIDAARAAADAWLETRA